MTLEFNQEFIQSMDEFNFGGGKVLITPAISSDYWVFRVVLYKDQALLAFPKFTTLGIGFALEEDWNTNLPYTTAAEEIYDHIEHNKLYNEITRDQCIEAIQMLQAAAKKIKEQASVNN